MMSNACDAALVMRRSHSKAVSECGVLPLEESERTSDDKESSEWIVNKLMKLTDNHV